MNTNGQKENHLTETQQLIDFLRLHIKHDKMIAERIGYAPSHLSNMYAGHESARRPGFALMLRALAFEVLTEAAKAGTLVKQELPLEVKSDVDKIRAIVREMMSEAA